MSMMFAALDLAGAVRFVGEVPRGAACGCVCPECASPLIAKQGKEREWHFAHEAGQERPECEAGALNLLRRLVIEHLHARPELQLPRYVARVAESSSTHRHVEEVAWDAGFAEPLDWLPTGPKHAPVATGRLDNGAVAHLFVHISEERSSFPSTERHETAGVVFWCPTPSPNTLRERSAVEGHIAQHALFVWTHQPDVLGLIEAARKRVRDLVAEDERSAAVLSKQREEEQARARRRASEEASRHWAEIANRLSKEPRHHDASESELARVPEPPTSAAGTSDLELAWAPEHKPSTSFIFYRLNAAEAWIVYTMKDGSSAIAPWPEADEGWDEALPAAVGVPDARLKVYRVKDLLLAMTFFSSRAGTIRATSNPRDFEKL